MNRRLFQSTWIRLALAVGGSVALFGLPAVAQAQEVIKIGAPLALTGGLADEGKKQQIAYEMWRDAVNSAGGIKVGPKKMKVELITYDYQSNTQSAVQITEKLITSDKVNFVLSPYGSGATKAAAAISERFGIPTIASVASSESVYDQNYKNLFGTLAPNSGVAEVMAGLFKKAMPSMKKIAIYAKNDLFPKAMGDTMAKTAPASGLEVVYSEIYAPTANDHSAALAKIKTLNPDWVFVSGYTQELVVIRKQMSDLGLTAPVITMITGPLYREYVEALGPLAENVTSTTWWHHNANFKSDDVFGSTEAFYKAFVAKFKSDPDYVHGSAAGSLGALQIAIEKAGTLDPAAVRKVLSETEFHTVYGPIKYGPTGQNVNKSFAVIQIQDKKPVILAPVDAKQGTLRLIGG